MCTLHPIGKLSLLQISGDCEFHHAAQFEHGTQQMCGEAALMQAWKVNQEDREIIT